MARWAPILLATTAAFALSLVGESQEAAVKPPTIEDVQKWFDQEWERARSLPDLSGLNVQWRREHRTLPTPEELAQLRAAVAGRPDHPDKGVLVQIERQLQGEPNGADFGLWYGQSKVLRLNQTPVQEPTQYSDYILDNEKVWGFSSHGMDIIDPANIEPGFDLPGVVTANLNDIRYLTSGGLWLGHILGFDKPTCELGVDRVTATAVHPGRGIGLSVIIEAGADGQPRITTVSFAGIDGPKPGDGDVVASDWHDCPVSGRAWARRVDFTQSGHQEPELVWTFAGARRMAEGEIESVTTMPAPDGADPVRGPLTFKVVNDRRPGTRTSTLFQADGPLTVPIMPSPAASDRQWLLVTGWIVAGSLGAMLFAIRIRRWLT